MPVKTCIWQNLHLVKFTESKTNTKSTTTKSVLVSSFSRDIRVKIESKPVEVVSSNLSKSVTCSILNSPGLDIANLS